MVAAVMAPARYWVVARSAVRAAATPSSSGWARPRASIRSNSALPSARRHSSTAASRRSASGPYDGGAGASATAPSRRAGDAVVPEPHEQRHEVAHGGHEVRRIAAVAEVVEQGRRTARAASSSVAAARPQRRRRQRRHLDQEAVAGRCGPPPRPDRGGRSPTGRVEVEDRPRPSRTRTMPSPTAPGTSARRPASPGRHRVRPA